jgi:hypothetical protein|tara:strand:+ start:194 stop:511 length:318 start_codon:yes stop_codon:yes gene_type:complete
MTRRVDPGFWSHLIGKQSDGTGKRQIRGRGPQHLAGRRVRVVSEDNRGSPSLAERSSVAGVRKEAKVVSPSRFKSSHSTDIDVSIAVEPTLKTCCHLTELQTGEV